MSARIIPFPPLGGAGSRDRKLRDVTGNRDTPYLIRATFKMLYNDIRAGRRKPRKTFVCYEDEDGQLYYLSLGYSMVRLQHAVGSVIADMVDDA